MGKNEISFKFSFEENSYRFMETNLIRKRFIFMFLFVFNEAENNID